VDRHGPVAGALRNRGWYQDRLGAVTVDGNAPATGIALAFDPQTAGGLLLALPPDRVDAWREDFARSVGTSWIIGSLESGAPGHLHLTR